MSTLANALPRLGVVLATAVAIVWVVASLTWPFGLDQGIFAWVGDAILRGGLPYRDAWEIKGPATHYLYAFAQLVFGRNVWGLRVLDLVLLLGSAAAAGAWIHRGSSTARASDPPAPSETRDGSEEGRTLAGWVAALVWVLLYATGGYWHAAQPDGWAAMAWLVAAWLVARPDPKRGRWLAAGALCAFAALLKPLFGAFLAVLWLDCAVRSGRPAALRALGPSVVGAAAVLGSVAFGFAAAGALGALLEVQAIFNPSLHPTAYREAGAGQLTAIAAGWLAQPWATAAVAAAAAGVAASWRTARADAVLVLVWCVLGVLLVLLQNQFFHYHFWPLLAGLSLGVGLAVREATRRPAAPLRWALVAGVAGVLALSAWAPVQQISAARAMLDPSQPAAQRYRAAFGMGSYGFPAMERIAARIRERTAPGDAILVWGFESGLYFLADRPASTRFGFLYPLVRGGGSALEAEYLREFQSSLRETPPAYVVVFAQSYDESALPAENRAALGALWSLLDRCYVRDEALVGERLVAWELDGVRCP